MNDQDLLALCVLEEAGGEPDEGRAAVARVIANRMKRKYQSDGTMVGTVLHYDAFSWAWFAFGGTPPKYHRVAWHLDQAQAIAEKKLASAPATALSQCRVIAAFVNAGTFHGDLYDKLTDDTVMYLNPHILDHLPDWAVPEKFVVRIGQQDFYRG